MQISGRDIEEAKRERLLIAADETFELREVALAAWLPRRCFELCRGETKIGLIFDDEIDPDVLGRLE